MSIWAYSIGTSIGWGSLVVTCNTYLAQAGVMGTALGLVLGMLVTFIIAHNLQYMICRNQDAGGIYSFALVVCDINNLKVINDQKGHNIGDECIRRRCTAICDIFANSPVYRIGGDEFAAVLENEDYENRQSLLEKVKNEAIEVDDTTTSKVAVGISEYRKGEDNSFLEVFTRADRRMYENKKEIKNMNSK